MIAAKKQDKATVISILSGAFKENKSVGYILGKGRKKARINHLMEYAFLVCRHYGKVFLSDDRKACALILLPDHRKNDLRSVWLDLKLILYCTGISHLRKTLQRENKIKTLQAVDKHQAYYLWFIGVEPGYQNQGIGSKLLAEITTDCLKMGRTLILETSVDSNLSWYRKNGLTIYTQYNFGYTLYFLKQ